MAINRKLLVILIVALVIAAAITTTIVLTVKPKRDVVADSDAVAPEVDSDAVVDSDANPAPDVVADSDAALRDKIRKTTVRLVKEIWDREGEITPTISEEDHQLLLKAPCSMLEEQPTADTPPLWMVMWMFAQMHKGIAISKKMKAFKKTGDTDGQIKWMEEMRTHAARESKVLDDPRFGDPFTLQGPNLKKLWRLMAENNEAFGFDSARMRQVVDKFGSCAGN